MNYCHFSNVPHVTQYQLKIVLWILMKLATVHNFIGWPITTYLNCNQQSCLVFTELIECMTPIVLWKVNSINDWTWSWWFLSFKLNKIKYCELQIWQFPYTLLTKFTSFSSLYLWSHLWWTWRTGPRCPSRGSPCLDWKWENLQNMYTGTQ